VFSGALAASTLISPRNLCVSTIPSPAGCGSPYRPDRPQL